MNAWEIIVGILMILVSIIIIGMVILQKGHRRGVGVVTGGADTFLSKNKARTADALLSKWTKIFAAAFFVLAIIGNVLALLK